MDKILCHKLKNGAKIPTKREEDGCYDLYACTEEDIIIPPHENTLIPTGICSAFSHKYRIAYRERGSNTKFNGIVMAGQIDSGYRGEWFVPIYNGNDYKIIFTNSVKEITFEPQLFPNLFGEWTPKSAIKKIPTSKAICQFAVEEVPTVVIQEATQEEIDNIVSERGVGMLGSSEK
jgi:dUTP pyrophosphatase